MARSAHDFQAHLLSRGPSASLPAEAAAGERSGTEPHGVVDDRGPAVLWQNLAVIQQGIDVIERLATSPEGEALYALAPKSLVHHGAGSHFRHIHDLYLCFLRDVAAGHVDYDSRERDERFERDPRHALRNLRQTVTRLEGLLGLHPELGGQAIEMRGEIEVKMDVEPHDRDPFTSSTPLRELRFLLSHTIHHYALIALILKVQGFDCGSGFGVAPSTLSFWQQSPGCAPQPGSGA